MAVTWLDPGGSATGGTEFWSTATSRLTAQTSVVNGQLYAYKFDTGNPASNQTGVKSAVVGVANRLSVWLYLPALPTGDTSLPILSVAPAGSGTTTLAIFITSTGKLRLYSNASSTALGAAGSSTVPTGQWFRLGLSYSITTVVLWSAKVYLDGVLEFTRTQLDGTLSSAAPADLRMLVASPAGTDFLAYGSDIYIDDTTDQTDPAAGIGNGEMRVTAKLPTTNTTNAFDTVIGSGAVNERPVNVANGWRHNASTDVDQDYDIQAAGTGDANLTSATIVGSIPWIWATLGSLTGTPSTNIIHNGARLTGTWDPASANVAQLFTGPPVTSATYPDNANGKNIGSSSSVIAADTFLYDCGVAIAYIPPGVELRSLAGDQPSATGVLTYSHGYLRSLAGDQPSSTGELTYIWATFDPGPSNAQTEVVHAVYRSNQGRG